MKKIGFFFLAALVLSTSLSAASPFSTLTGTDLNGQPFSLSISAAARPVVLIIGFTKASSDACQTYEDDLWMDYGADTRVAIASVANLQGVPGFIMPFIKAGMRRGSPDARWPWKVISVKERALWQKEVAFDPGLDDPEAYLMLLDAKHKQVLLEHGAFVPLLYERLKDAINKILPNAIKK